MACEICKKPYKASSGKNSVDYNEKPHVCNICGKSFSLKIQLKRHVLFHEEDAPYICNTCEKHLEQTSYNLRLSKKGNFTCETCSKSFPSKRLLLRHASEHTSENSLNCNECGESFKNATALKRHAAVHKPKKKDAKSNTRKNTSKSSHLCNDCGKRFSQLQLLEKHQLSHQYHCSTCSVNFGSGSLLDKHKANSSCQSKINSSVDLSDKNVDDKKHVCDICNKSFARKSALEGHVVSHFTDGRESTVEDDSDIDVDFQCNYKDDKPIEPPPKRQCLPKLKIRRSFTCEMCKVVCASKKMFDKHVASHNKIENWEEKKNYTCRICDEAFYSKEVYREHKLSHETKEDVQNNKEKEQKSLKYACQHCDTKFLKKKYLRKHLKTHVNADPNEATSIGSEETKIGEKRKKRLKNFECSICGKRFAGETCLKKHEAKHSSSGESDSSKGRKDKKSSLNLVCEFCEEDFTGRKHAYLKHKLSHTPEVCGICDARFVDRASLREHCRIHIGTEEGRRFMECSQKALDAKNGVVAPEPKVEYIYLVLR